MVMKNLQNSNYPQRTIFLFSLLLISFFSFAQESPIIKKRIAVFAFKDESDFGGGWGRYKTVGEGLADMLTTELVQAGQYRVIEREELESLLAEQDLGGQGIVTQESAAKLGQILGVELAVVGSVTEFGYKDRGGDGAVKQLGLGYRNQAATVGVDVRLINTSTGEIMAAEQVRKTKSTKGVKLRTRDVNLDNRRGFDESVVGKAAREAVQRVAGLVNENMEKVPWKAKVITLNSGLVYINAGATDGIKSGDQFYIYNEGESLIDPDTGLKLGSIEKKIGKIKVVDPNIGDGKASQCQVLDGSDFKKGNIVKTN